MNREEALREALAQLAQEEADELESSLSRSDIRQAEALYRRHRPKALSLIRRNTERRGSVTRYLIAAAVLAALIGMMYLSMNQRAPENIPLTQGPTVSVLPYYSPTPTDSPVPTETAANETPEPTNAPEWDENSTIRPDTGEMKPLLSTEKPELEEIQGETATFTHNPTEIPTSIPTVQPTSTPIPTLAPTQTPSPTETPAASPTAEPTPPPENAANTSAIPDGWTGSYFPYALPGLGEPVSFDAGSSWRSVTYTGPEGEWRFTEYDESDLIQVPNGMEASYVQWGDTVALRFADERGVTLAWVQDGRSFSLQGTPGQETSIAESVKKISEQ